jgi:uncharacterized protein YdhG (YjbR/CyaY superfamily)
MQSQAATVDEYFTELPADRQAAMEQLRALCLRTLTGFTESMTYGMPCYSRNGEVEIAFNSQKNNISLYILRKEILDQHRTAFPASALGKGCIRYRNVDKIDYALVETMLQQTAATPGEVC